MRTASVKTVASEEPITELTLMDHILTFAPLTILILIIAGLVLIIKKREKNPDRVEFENKCKAFEKRTLFLRVFVIYIIPFYIACSVATICSLVINVHKFATGEIVFIFMFEFIKSAFMYVTRKEAFKLSKKSYYYLYICAALICITGLITEDILALKTVAIPFFYFFFYLSKRSFLFGID